MRMSKKFVTTGGKYTDIDGFACVMAYTELLQLEGKDATALLIGPLNHSVTAELRSLHLPYVTTIPAEGDLIIVDVSDPEYLASYFNLEMVTEIFDHHFGFEKYWDTKLATGAGIAAVGSCTTLIWEQYKSRGFAHRISTVSANLLAIAILSNTLNFKASVTDDRDRAAFAELQVHMDLPQGWEAEYFKETEAEIFNNPQESIRNDTKIQEVKELGKTFIIGQMELWNSQSFIEEYRRDITTVLESFGNEYWFMTSPSISEGKNYIYTKSEYIKQLFIDNFDAVFRGDVGVTPRLWMRKEILKKFYSL